MCVCVCVWGCGLGCPAVRSESTAYFFSERMVDRIFEWWRPNKGNMEKGASNGALIQPIYTVFSGGVTKGSQRKESILFGLNMDNGYKRKVEIDRVEKWNLYVFNRIIRLSYDVNHLR